MQNLSEISLINDLFTLILTSAVVSTPIKKKVVSIIKKTKNSGKITEKRKVDITGKRVK